MRSQSIPYFEFFTPLWLTAELHLLVKTGESPEAALSVHRDTAPLTPLHGRACRSFKVRFLNLSSKPCAVGLTIMPALVPESQRRRCAGTSREGGKRYRNQFPFAAAAGTGSTGSRRHAGRSALSRRKRPAGSGAGSRPPLTTVSSGRLAFWRKTIWLRKISPPSDVTHIPSQPGASPSVVGSRWP